MMMTDAAIVSLDDSWRSLRRRVSSWFHPVDRLPSQDDPAAMAPFVDGLPAQSEDEHRKSARVAAVRGLLYARDGQLDRAEIFFSEALTLDPALSPADVPTFWNLPRTGQEAAVRALQNAGRPRDAQLLAGEIAYRRPIRAAS
jgi:tetratricopeptide (TPR) repeat protein